MRIPLPRRLWGAAPSPLASSPRGHSRQRREEGATPQKRSTHCSKRDTGTKDSAVYLYVEMELSQNSSRPSSKVCVWCWLRTTLRGGTGKSGLLTRSQQRVKRLAMGAGQQRRGREEGGLAAAVEKVRWDHEKAWFSGETKMRSLVATGRRSGSSLSPKTEG